MARLVKFLLTLVAAIVGIGVLAGVTLYLFFDPNDFREDISAGVKEATGRDLQIEGDLSLSVFPWIAVEIGRTQLGNAAGFGDEPFLTFEAARLSVRLMPLLFSQDIAIGTATLESLAVNLQIDRNGVTNWDDLASATDEAKEQADEDGAPVSGGFDIANMSVSNASISYSDARDGSRSTVSGLSLKTGQITAGSPFDLDAEFNFDSSPGDFGGQLSIDGTIMAGEGMSLIDISGLNISGTLRGIAEQATEFNFDARAMNIDTNAQILTLGEMDLGLLGLSMTAIVEPFSYAGDPQPKASIRVNSFSPKELMAVLGTEPPETADPNALQNVSFSANAAVGAKAIALSDLQLVLDDTTMSGTMSLPRTAGGKLTFKLAVDSMVLDHYMAPSADSEAVSDDSDTNVEIPTELIRSLNASGSFEMKEAILSGIVFENFKLTLNSANGKLRLHPMSAEMFGGSYRGDVRIDASGQAPVISVNEYIVDVQLAKLSTAMYDADNVSGTINGSFVLSGRGADLNAIRRDLDGNISFVLSDGEYLGTDVWYELRKARAAFKRETPPEPRLPARTEFSSVSATGTVTDGVMRNDDFLAELPFLRLTGAGTVNFVEASLNYSMDARVLKSPEFAAEVSEKELKDFTSAVIPMKISGPLASPSIKPDIEAMLKQEVKKQLKKKEDELKKKLLNRLLGGKDEQTSDAEGAEDGEEEEEPDAEEEIKDVLKGLFGK